MQFANRLEFLQANVFADMDRAKADAALAGQNLIDLSLGSSDLLAAPHVVEAIAIIICCLFYQWRHQSARSTPRSPKVNQYWSLGFEYFCFKLSILNCNYSAHSSLFKYLLLIKVRCDRTSYLKIYIA